MKKFIIIGLTALALGGCAGGQSVLVGGQSLTASTANPVTADRLAQIEEALTAAAGSAVVYRRLCLSGKLPASCKAIVVKMKGYANTAKPMLARLRTFVKTNDQINAITVFNQLAGVIFDLQSTATAQGVVQ